MRYGYFLFTCVIRNLYWISSENFPSLILLLLTVLFNCSHSLFQCVQITFWINWERAFRALLWVIVIMCRWHNYFWHYFWLSFEVNQYENGKDEGKKYFCRMLLKAWIECQKWNDDLVKFATCRCKKNEKKNRSVFVVLFVRTAAYQICRRNGIRNCLGQQILTSKNWMYLLSNIPIHNVCQWNYVVPQIKLVKYGTQTNRSFIDWNMLKIKDLDTGYFFGSELFNNVFALCSGR